MSEHFISSLLAQQIIKEPDIVKLQYGIAVIKSEAVKTALLIVIFNALGLLIPFLFLLSLSMPLRMSTGGIHISSSEGCFILSLALYLAQMTVLLWVPLDDRQYTAMLIISIITILLMSPAPSPKRPIKTKKRYITNRSISCILCIFWGFMIQYFIVDSQLVHCGIWALSLQAIEVTFVSVINKWKRRNSYV